MPEAILLQDVEQLGEKGTVVDVSKGYLRNYLIPRRLAQPATRGLLEQARRRREAAEAAAREHVPAGRLGTVEELAAVAAFLCSARASYVTGTAVLVDGGLTQSV